MTSNASHANRDLPLKKYVATYTVVFQLYKMAVYPSALVMRLLRAVESCLMLKLLCEAGG